MISPVIWHRHSPEGALWEEHLSWLQREMAPEQSVKGSPGVCPVVRAGEASRWGHAAGPVGVLEH